MFRRLKPPSRLLAPRLLVCACAAALILFSVLGRWQALPPGAGGWWLDGLLGLFAGGLLAGLWLAFARAGRAGPDPADAGEMAKAAAEIEARYREFVDDAMRGVLIHHNRKILHCNQACAELFGYDSPAELLALGSLNELLAAQDLPGTHSSGAEAGGKKSKDRYIDIQCTRKDGLQVRLGVYSRPTTWEGRSAVMSVFLDFTETKQAEESQRASQRLMDTVFDNVPLGVFVKDLQGRFVMGNNAWAEFWGREREELLGRTIDEFGGGTEEQNREIKDADRRVIETGERVVLPESSYTLRDGETRWRRLVKAPLYNDAGEITGVVGIREDITDRRQSDERLRANEEKFRNLAEGSIEGIYVQRDWHILYANEAMAGMFGFETPREMLGYDVLNLFHEEERPTLERYYHDRMAGREAPARYESRGLRKNGEVIWLEFIVRVVDWEGAPAIQATLMDITERKHAEEELRASQRLLQTVFDVIPHLMAIKDSESRYVKVNRAWCELYGLKPEDVIGRHPSQLTTRPKEDIRLVLEEDRAVLSGKDAVQVFEGTRISGSGERRIFQNIKARMEGEGKEIEGIVTIGLDITERRRAEEELRASQRLLRTVFDALPVGVFVKDSEHRFIMVNQAFADLYGRNPEDIIGAHSSDLLMHDEQAFQNSLESDRTVLEEGRPAEIQQEKVTTADGQVFWRRALKVPLLSESGEVTGIVGIREDITEKIHAERELRTSQRLLQTVFDTLPLGLYIKDTDGRYIMTNQAFAAKYNLAPEDLVGKHGQDIHEPDAESRRKSEITNRRVLVAGRPAVIPEQKMTVKGGGSYWRRAVKVPLKDEHGNVTGIVCAQEDITESKRAEEQELGRSKVLEMLATGSSLEQVLEQIIATTESLYPEVSCAVLLLDEEQKRLRLAAAPSLPDAIAEAVERVELTAAAQAAPAEDKEEPVPMDQLMAFPVWTEIADVATKEGLKACWSQPITSPDNKLLGTFIMYFREPREPSKTETEQMRIAVHLAGIAVNRSRIEQALRGSEERFRNLVDQAVDAFFIMEPDGTIVDVNRQACESLNYTRGELLSMRVEDFEANAEIVDNLNEWRQGGEFAPLTLNGAHRRKDGTTFPVELRLGAIHSGDNVLVLAVARDQTERKWLEDQFTHAQKMRAIGGLAGGIAHEFNNILTPLIGYTNLAQNRLNPEDEAFKDLEIVKKAADRARDMVAQILLFSRKKEGERKPLQVDLLAKEVLMLFSSVLPKSIVIVQKVDPGLALVSADPTQLHVLLMNLFTNANQAMPDGGLLHLNIGNVNLSDFEITPRQKVSGRFVHIQVKDTGVGMDEATVARIFEPFFTTKELGQGTGMGLSSVYGIVKSHDGYIMVDSQEGVGTTFDVYLPAIDTGLAATHELVEQDSTGRESILFVDDEEDITQLGKYGLQRLGYNVTAVTNPEYALQLFRENADGFDLVATDQVMPQMNGDALVRAIREIRTDIPIIISTGFDRKFADGELEELGVDKLLLKPFNYEELGRAIREVLDAHYMKKGAEAPHSETRNPGDVAEMGAEEMRPAPPMETVEEVSAARISLIESEDGIVIEISGQDTLTEEDKQILLGMYAQAKKNGKHTVVQCESGLYEFLKVTGFDKFLELSVLQ